ncbi:glycosyltransferase family 4 protein [Campylobacter sp. JMF_04 NA10]|uniref:glycosyltransferase family 4 protein n=1 Tax=Campylobacter sp. JMF_04 NA10 TaxID=2983824 RepID=UPI0022E9EACF|nr:glycosyltransferase family 4 protein [Campylobacter sp. JMF_04 NA10]MDA3076642.1 glycosyltransferase family 4 protein [Campylobacter sp. JMF_04 NA10]
MRVVQILPELNEGGVERGVVELTREFAKFGVENIVISNGGKLVSELEKNGVRHIKFDVCSKNIFTAFSRASALKEILREIAPDIVHVRSRVPAWLVKFAKRGLNFGLVSTVHGLNSVNFYSKIMVKADKIICVSNATKDYVVRNFGADVSKIRVIPRGIDLEKFNPSNLDAEFMAKFRAEFGLKKGDFIVASVGRITQLKDYETLIKAGQILKQSFGEGLKILIVGGVRDDKKEYFLGLQNLARELNLAQSVIFTGSQSKIPEIYALSNVVVSASKKPESFGRSVAEAIALNAPVVASNHGGVLDIIKSGENGEFFAVGDERGLAAMIERAKDYKFDGYGYIAENFSLAQMVEKTMSVYKEMV